MPELTTGTFIYYLFGCAIICTAFYFLTRWVFGIDKRIQQNALIIQLLEKLVHQTHEVVEEPGSLKK